MICYMYIAYLVYSWLEVRIGLLVLRPGAVVQVREGTLMWSIFLMVNDNRNGSTRKQSGPSATLTNTKFMSSDLGSNLGLPYQ
jgi:hypothetical protein